MNGDNSRSIATFPLEEGRIRIMVDNGVLSPEGHAAQKSEDLTMEVVQELVNQIVGPSVRMKLLDCHWLTYYRVNERLAERYSHENRIFLAGDAAHVHSPAGGQGMTIYYSCIRRQAIISFANNKKNQYRRYEHGSSGRSQPCLEDSAGHAQECAPLDPRQLRDGATPRGRPDHPALSQHSRGQHGAGHVPTRDPQSRPDGPALHPASHAHGPSHVYGKKRRKQSSHPD